MNDLYKENNKKNNNNNNTASSNSAIGTLHDDKDVYNDFYYADDDNENYDLDYNDDYNDDYEDYTNDEMEELLLLDSCHYSIGNDEAYPQTDDLSNEHNMASCTDMQQSAQPGSTQICTITASVNGGLALPSTTISTRTTTNADSDAKGCTSHSETAITFTAHNGNTHTSMAHLLTLLTHFSFYIPPHVYRIAHPNQ